MPALTRLRIEALAQLADELRFSPKATLLKQLERAEALVWALDPSQTYPEEWVIHQITRHRVQRDEPALILGAALRSELSAFVERVSHDAKLTPAHAPPGALRLPQLRDRWRVSARTIERWRRQGLIARRERLPDGKSRLVFSRASVEAFETRCAASVERAKERTRVSREESAAMGRRAAAHANGATPATRNAAAAVLAPAFGRSRSTIRAHLRSATDERGEAIFTERQPLRPLEARWICRALRRGASPASLAQRLGRSPAAVRRADRMARLARLRACMARDAGDQPALSHQQGAPQASMGAAQKSPLPLGEGGERSEPGEGPRAASASSRSPSHDDLVSRDWAPRRAVFPEEPLAPGFSPKGRGRQRQSLSPSPSPRGRGEITAPADLRVALAVAQALHAPLPRGEAALGAFLADAAAAPQPPDAQRERALAGAHRDLLAAASRALSEINPLHPAASSLDEVETALRLAWRLRCELVRTQLRIIRAALEERLEGSLADIAPEHVVRLHLLAMRSACAAAARFDPSRGGRLSASTTIALARILAPATRNIRAAVGRARRADIEATPLSDWTLRAARWAPALLPTRALVGALPALPTDHADLLSLRLGLEGQQPHTKAQLAEQLALPLHIIARRERRALASACRLA